ncbi:MAG: M28 family peptidase [Bacteroidales bacterium]|nr:M28 family peptidase [Bacteroidales bacterium]
MGVSLLLLPFPSLAQSSGGSGGFASLLLSEESLGMSVEFLSDTLCAGRATETPGAVEASFWLARNFERMGLQAPGSRRGSPGYVRSFIASGKVGHNVIGFCPAPSSDRYAIVAAHYDNLGILSERMYPGADSNASGVAAMLGLARICRSLSVLGLGIRQNVIFVALDAKQLSMAGSASLYGMLSDGSLLDPRTGRPVRLDQVSVMVNLDIVGSTLEPVTKGRDEYLIMLTNDDSLKRALSEANYSTRLNLDLSFDYYRSKDFTDLFLNRIGDQKVFVDGGIPSALFTSGITMNTNKVEDTPATLDLAVLRKRVLLVFDWMERVLR